MATAMDTSMDKARSNMITESITHPTWDSVVIGGGLAGCLAARQLALRGQKVLLLEKQTFPRAKVCGSCLNSRAISSLRQVGLGNALHALGGKVTNRFQLFGFGRHLQCDVPEGLAISRGVLDEALLQEARRAGVKVVNNVSAQVVPTTERKHHRVVRVQANSASPLESQKDVHVHARTVVAADGLGHPSLRKLPEFQEKIRPGAKIGLGAIVEEPQWSSEVPSGDIQMYASKYGYAGIVRAESDSIALAAAVDPSFIKERSKPADAFNQLLKDAGSSLQLSSTADWRGTPLLNRTINRVSSHRIFVVGDAAGYVEPFTGEGMAWAISGGVAVADCIQTGHDTSYDEAELEWQKAWQSQVRKRQKWCRALSWSLRKPTRARLGIHLLSYHPSMSNLIAKQIAASTH